MFGQILCPSHPSEPVRFFNTSAATWSQWGFLSRQRATLNVTTMWRPTLIFLAAASVYKLAVAFSSSWSSVVFHGSLLSSQLIPILGCSLFPIEEFWLVMYTDMWKHLRLELFKTMCKILPTASLYQDTTWMITPCRLTFLVGVQDGGLKNVVLSGLTDEQSWRDTESLETLSVWVASWNESKVQNSVLWVGTRW